MLVKVNKFTEEEDLLDTIHGLRLWGQFKKLVGSRYANDWDFADWWCNEDDAGRRPKFEDDNGLLDHLLENDPKNHYVVNYNGDDWCVMRIQSPKVSSWKERFDSIMLPAEIKNMSDLVTAEMEGANNSYKRTLQTILNKLRMT